MLLVTSALEIYLNLESWYNSGEGRTLENCSCLKFLLHMSVCVCVCMCICLFLRWMKNTVICFPPFSCLPLFFFFFFYQFVFFFFFLVAKHMSGEGNGNPFQCSCLEKPRDGVAWWAAVYGVAQSRTRLKRLSSSSSSKHMSRFLF